jgi:hypothetical protein
MTKNEKPMFIRELHIMFRSKAKADATQSYFGDDAPVTVIPPVTVIRNSRILILGG